MKKIVIFTFTLLFLVGSQCFAQPPECKEPGAPSGCFNKAKNEKLVLPKSISSAMEKGKSITLLSTEASKSVTEGKTTNPDRQICSLKCETFNVCDDKGRCHPEKICYRECGEVD